VHPTPVQTSEGAVDGSGGSRGQQSLEDANNENGGPDISAQPPAQAFISERLQNSPIPRQPNPDLSLFVLLDLRWRAAY